MIKYYEAKFELRQTDALDERQITNRLGLNFIKEYTDMDIYLKTRRKDSFKLKVTDDGTIWYHVKYTDGVFEIVGKAIDEKKKKEILKAHPVEISVHRINRVYSWKKFMLKCDFDDIEKFPDSIFFKVYSISPEAVKSARDYIVHSGIKNEVNMAYNKLYAFQNSRKTK